MTIGIYALYWEEQDLIYIGQSVNIEARFRDHISALKRQRHFNYLVQNTYDLYGIPRTHILETAISSEYLDIMEYTWILETEANLNITSGGCSGGKGIHHSQFKFTKLQILCAFRYLSSTKFKLSREISEITGISIGIIEAIIASKAHIWLKEKYPYKFRLMLSLRKERETFNSKNRKALSEKYKISGKDLPIVISPDGTEYLVANIREFARDHKLPTSSANYMINGKREACKGWKLKTI